MRSGFWQAKFAIPTIFAVLGLLVLVGGLSISHAHRMSVLSYEAGYESGLDFGKTQGLFSEYQLTEESKGLTCGTLFDIDEDKGFEVGGQEISSSSINEDEYYEGCRTGMDDGFDSYR
ncbi:hypothetical protein [Brevibacterium aurantiacum]|uniref:hypothetical protein n=1 Tax=Brevibacterium aurantiacum TaxID=273384 RepID=UPI00196A32A6|nr:hypothetical protein [Brevibacterium aurantiacum]